MKFIFLSLRKNILPFIFILLAICLVIFSNSNLTAAKFGLTLWANNVVPALFPFFVVSELLSNTNVIYYLGRLLNKIMRPVFNVPGEGAFPFIMGLISGYPVGGKIVSDLRANGIVTRDEGERLLAFTNNSGPLFIISSVGISLFGDTKTGILLLSTHILACITVGIILSKFSTKVCQKSPPLSTINVDKSLPYAQSTAHIKVKQNIKKHISFKDLGEILGKSINSAISTILMIGGFVVIFSVIISIMQQTHLLTSLGNMFSPIFQSIGFNLNFAKPVLSGIIELTNGISQVAQVNIKNISQNVVLSAFLLGFGGISVLLQVFSIVSKTDLSMKKYVIGKLLQGILAAIYTSIALNLLPFLNLDIVPTCAPIAEAVIYPITFFGLNSFALLIIVLILILLIVFSQPDRKKYKGNYHHKKC